MQHVQPVTIKDRGAFSAKISSMTAEIFTVTVMAGNSSNVYILSDSLVALEDIGSSQRSSMLTYFIQTQGH